MEEKRPAACYGVLGGELVYLQPNKPYSPELLYDKGDPALNSREADRLNDLLGVTPSQRTAMEAGAVLGWQYGTPAPQERRSPHRWGPGR